MFVGVYSAHVRSIPLVRLSPPFRPSLVQAERLGDNDFVVIDGGRWWLPCVLPLRPKAKGVVVAHAVGADDVAERRFSADSMRAHDNDALDDGAAERLSHC